MSSKILVVDDKQIMRDSVAATLQRAGFAVVTASDGKAALKQAGKHRPAAVITDLRMPEMDGLSLLTELRAVDPSLPVVLMTAYGTVSDAVAAMQQGAFDFVQKPFEGDQLVMVVRRAVQHRELTNENEALRTGGARTDAVPSLVGKSTEMRRLAQQIHQVANSSGTVLIAGESGTGKEVVARTIHAHSPRRDNVMLCVNCAALSSSLLESELFGHERGAFTGADQLRKGRFELADGGTLLLDEISEISPTLQAKLLRVLQEGQFERVGSSTTLSVDVRVLATTNRDLRFSVASGQFRQDLYYRLNVLPIELPPLRDRTEDIPLLAEHFLATVAMREGREPRRLEPQAVALLKEYPWPGNVRELQNICERASVLTRSGLIKPDLIQPWLQTPGPSAPTTPVPVSQGHAPTPIGHAAPPHGQELPPRVAEGPVRALEEVERAQIMYTLNYFSGNRQKTAKALGIGVRTLGLKLKKWKEQQLIAQSA
ncbi:sigma-54-dependent transcriptional regulator [Mucisphaera calidilacus]|uniref:Transcriptional regulatory protein ZraR n=1 Tax=Mucisphaera calidilacus TaxID=2527982 RepID=A0A518BYY9_9BACT|nr:sigma-54 dependent transcriptional regulator [Mucisphaera calidilacus]QDU72191.1 Transcriptional regulatory protein ZraR [Mucisphaera calidilacus]